MSDNFNYSISKIGLMSKIVYELAERESCEEESTRFINFITEAKSIGYTKFHMDTTVTCYPKCKSRFQFCLLLTNNFSLLYP